MIYKGPVIKRQLHVLIGFLFWVLCSAVHEYWGGVFRWFSIPAGWFAIWFTSTGVYLEMNARSKPEPEDKVDS